MDTSFESPEDILGARKRSHGHRFQIPGQTEIDRGVDTVRLARRGVPLCFFERANRDGSLTLLTAFGVPARAALKPSNVLRDVDQAFPLQRERFQFLRERGQLPAGLRWVHRALGPVGLLQKAG